jgi:hypothetical protein
MGENRQSQSRAPHHRGSGGAHPLSVELTCFLLIKEEHKGVWQGTEAQSLFFPGLDPALVGSALEKGRAYSFPHHSPWSGRGSVANS